MMSSYWYCNNWFHYFGDAFKCCIDSSVNPRNLNDPTGSATQLSTTRRQQNVHGPELFSSGTDLIRSKVATSLLVGKQT